VGEGSQETVSIPYGFSLALFQFPLQVFFISETPGKARMNFYPFTASAKAAAAFTACLAVFAIRTFPFFLFYRQQAVSQDKFFKLLRFLKMQYIFS